MRWSLELWSTVSSVGTFAVIGATALVALVQLRHIRRANQLAGLQSIFAMLQDPGVRELVNYVRHDLASRMQDATFRQSLLAIPIDRREHPELYLQTDWYNVSLYWGLLRGVIEQSRQSRPPQP